MATDEMDSGSREETREQVISKRLDGVGWALFFIMIGGIGLVPEESIPEGAWLVGVGLIMLGVNVARYVSGLKMIGSRMLLGLLALGIGLGAVLGVELPVFPVLLILVGVSIIVRILVGKG